MKIMDSAWPLTMLHRGPVGVAAYCWFGRTQPQHHHAQQDAPMSMMQHGQEKPMWQATFVAAGHCGTGCAVGDFIGDWFAFGTGITVFGFVFGGTYVCAFALAHLFGILFRYFSVTPMQELNLRDGLVAAVKIDTLSLLACEVGMFAWMGFRAWRFPDMEPTQWSSRFMMQIAMMIGFATTYPLNWWLIKRGVKEKM